MPVYDAAGTLAEALASIAGQTFADFECVIVDDGARDESRAITRAFAAKDRRFRLLERPHAGIVAALGAGLEACRGRFVARMDADDVMHPERLARQLALLEARPELAAAGCHVRLFPRQGLSPGRLEYEGWLNSILGEADVLRDRFVECPIAHPTLCARTEVLRRFGYRDRGWAEDYDLLLRMLEAGLRIGVVPEPLLDWRDAPDRLSRTSPSCSIESFTECKAEFLARSFLEQQSEYLLWGYGDTGRSLCRALRRHEKRPSAIVELHPGRLGQRIAGAPVIRPEELASVPRRPLVASVAGRTARSEIREALARFGFTEQRDYVCAA
jgi:glycosyltransferase involved in cell wall biosynthesis